MTAAAFTQLPMKTALAGGIGESAAALAEPCKTATADLKELRIAHIAFNKPAGHAGAAGDAAVVKNGADAGTAIMEAVAYLAFPVWPPLAFFAQRHFDVPARDALLSDESQHVAQLRS